MRKTLSWVKRTVLVVLSCILVVCLGLTGCTTVAEHPLEEQPHPVSEQDKIASGNNNKAVLWYDNTMSMAGFLNARDRGTFVNSINAMFSAMLEWTGERAYKVLDLPQALDDPNEKRYLEWLGYSETQLKVDAIQQPVKESFYTFGDAKKFEDDIGPWGILFSTDTGKQKRPSDFDFGNLNIFITDLKEQHMNLADLARALNVACESYDNHGVVLYALRSGFTGTCYISNTGTIIDGESNKNMIEHSLDNEPLQYYIIASGATPDILMFARAFEESLGRNSVSGYESFTLLSNGGLRPTDPKEFSPAPQTGTNGKARNLLKNSTSADLPLDEIHGALQLSPEKNMETFYKNYQSNRTVFGYRYDGTNNKNCNTALVKIHIPLPALLAKSELEEDMSGSKEVAAQWVFLKNANDKPPEGCIGIFVGESGANQLTLRYGNRSGWIDAAEADYDLLKVYASIVPNGTEQKLWDNLDNRTAYICNNASGVLELTVEIAATGNAGKNLQARANSGYVSVHIPLFARMAKSNKIPPWVTDWDFVPERDMDEKDIFKKTDGLDNFFAALLSTVRSPYWEIPLASLDVDIDMCDGALDGNGRPGCTN